MKIKAIRQLSEKELGEKLGEARFELAKERAASEIGTAKNPGRIRAVRKDIARMNTILNETAAKTGKVKTAPKAEKAPAKPKAEAKLNTDAVKQKAKK